MKQGILKNGDVFGKYTVERLLGTGGMGAVYLVRHQLLGALYALKVLDAAAVSGKSGDMVERFKREAKIASNTRHPNLAEVYDAGFDEVHGLHYLVMEYLPGGNLRDRLAEKGRLAPQEAVQIVRQIAAVLVTISQKGIVHRDIKPDNIMFSANGAAKLTDLGIAKGNGEQDTLVTMASAVFGTPSYMAPEQAQDASSVDCRADIWSLGVVLYEMLAGRRPYEGKGLSAIVAQLLSSDPFPDIRAVAPDVPDALACLIGEMCMKDRERRLASPRELCERLATLDLSPPRRVPSNGPVTQVTMVTERTIEPMASPAAAVPSVEAAAPYVEPEPDPEVMAFEKSVTDKIKQRERRRYWMRIIICVLAGVVVLLFGWALLRSPAPITHGHADSAPEPSAPAPASNVVAAPVSPRPAPASASNVVAAPVSPRPASASASNVVENNGSSPVAASNEAVTVVEPPPLPPVATNAPPVLPPPDDGAIALVGVGSEEGALRAAAGGGGKFYRLAGRPDRVSAQIGAVVATHPGRIYLSLVGYAAAREMSLQRFELYLNEVVKSLVSSNVPFVLVAGATEYGGVVRAVAQRQSWDVMD